MANVETTNIKGREDLTAGTITKNYMLPAFNESGEMQGITISELEDNMAINNLTNISDGNLAIAEKGKRKVYRLGEWATNMPRSVNSTWCIEASNFNDQVIFQNATLQSDASYYTRIGTSADGITWTWGSWVKLTTETDLVIFQKVHFSASNSLFLGNACQKMGITSQNKSSFKITLISESGKRCVAYAVNYVLNTTSPTMTVIENTTGASSCLSSCSATGSVNMGGITEPYSLCCELIGLL